MLLEDYFKEFCLVFLTCVAFAFKIGRDVKKYCTIFFVPSPLFSKEKVNWVFNSPFFCVCLAGRVENRCFKSVSCHISSVLGFFYISFDSYLEYWNWNSTCELNASS